MTTKLVRDLMHIGVITCPGHTLVSEAVNTLLRDNLESLVVMDDNGHAIGVFGRKEAITAFGLSGVSTQNWQTLTVDEITCPDILEVPPDIPTSAAAQLMLDQGVRVAYLLHHDGGFRWPAAELRFEDVLRYLVSEPERAF